METTKETWLGIQGEGILTERSLSGQRQQAKDEAWLRRGLRGAYPKFGHGESLYQWKGSREIRSLGKELFSSLIFLRNNST